MSTAPDSPGRPTLSLFGMNVAVNPNVPEDEVHVIQTDPLTGARTRHKIINVAGGELRITLPADSGE